MAVTMKDIAQRAGVSIGTVDRALNNRGRINPGVAEKIRGIAQEMNYRTNSLAKSLSSRNRQRRIAVVLHVQRNNFFDAVEEGIRQSEEAIRDFGIEIKIYRNAGFDPEDQLRQINQAVADGASGIILVPIDTEPIRKRVAELHEEGIPVVFFG